MWAVERSFYTPTTSMCKHQMLRGNARDCRETENSAIDFFFFPWLHRCLFTFMTPLFVADGDEVMGKGALVQTQICGIKQW